MLSGKKGFQCESPPALTSDPIFFNCRTLLGNYKIYLPRFPAEFSRTPTCHRDTTVRVKQETPSPTEQLEKTRLYSHLTTLCALYCPNYEICRVSSRNWHRRLCREMALSLNPSFKS